MQKRRDYTPVHYKYKFMDDDCQGEEQLKVKILHLRNLKPEFPTSRFFLQLNRYRKRDFFHEVFRLFQDALQSWDSF